MLLDEGRRTAGRQAGGQPLKVVSMVELAGPMRFDATFGPNRSKDDQMLNAQTLSPARKPVGRDATRPLVQKTIGILGGMSNQATAEYYRMLNERLNSAYGGWDNGEILIASVNFGNIEYFVRENLWDEAAGYLGEKFDALMSAGADLIICVSNTMHRVVAPIAAQRGAAFIHIADPAGRALAASGIKTAGLIGTSPVMESQELKERFRDLHGVEIVSPNAADRALVDKIIFDELVRRDIRESSRAQLVQVVKRLRDAGAEGLILGCTEFCLLVGADDFDDLPTFDTTALHVDAVVSNVLGED